MITLPGMLLFPPGHKAGYRDQFASQISPRLSISLSLNSILDPILELEGTKIQQNSGDSCEIRIAWYANAGDLLAMGHIFYFIVVAVVTDKIF